MIRDPIVRAAKENVQALNETPDEILYWVPDGAPLYVWINSHVFLLLPNCVVLKGPARDSINDDGQSCILDSLREDPGLFEWPGLFPGISICVGKVPEGDPREAMRGERAAYAATDIPAFTIIGAATN